MSSIPFDDPALFKTPTSAILVSTLWSFSLVISLSCALLATLLQRWARRYLDITSESDDPQERAQTRELMSQALKKYVSLSWMVEFLPFLLHTSVFLFLFGFVVYLFAFNSLVAKSVAACAGISLMFYLFISFVPILSCVSPYSTPLTPVIWFIAKGLLSFCFYLQHSAVRWGLLQVQEKERRRIEENCQFYFQLMQGGITTGVKKLANTPSGLATCVLLATFNFIDGISDLERFLSYLPGFNDSALAKDHSQNFRNTSEHPLSYQLPSKIIHFIDHVLSSKSLEPDEKRDHIAMCSKAMKWNTSILENTFYLTLQDPGSEIFNYPDFIELAVDPWRKDLQSPMKSFASGVLAIGISRSRAPLTEHWINIAQDYLGVADSKAYLPDAQGHLPDAENLEIINNLRLCSLVYLTHHLVIVDELFSDEFAEGMLWHKVLDEVAQNVCVTGIAPGLRERFITLWKRLDELRDDRKFWIQLNLNAAYVQDRLKTVDIKLRADPEYHMPRPPATDVWFNSHNRG